MVEQISRIASGNAKPARMGMSRASSLDVMKCFAAFCVVWIHLGSGWLPTPIVRCAVPIFFMISGYYYPTMVEKGTFWKHVRKLLFMTLGAVALYGIYTLLKHIRHENLHDWLTNTFCLERIVKFLVFNFDLFAGHLWYLWAVLYDLLIFYVADKLNLYKWLKYIVPVLLLFFFIGNFTPYDSYCRNFLFMGLPCMMTGRLIRENESKAFLLTKKKLWICTFVSLLLLGIEMLLLKYLCHVNGIRNMYIFTIPLILPFFYYAVNNPSFGEGSWFASVGKKDSAYIYIFHMLAGYSLYHFWEFDAYLLTRMVYPFLVFAVSLFMSWLFRQFLQIFRVS